MITLTPAGADFAARLSGLARLGRLKKQGIGGVG